MGLFIARDLKLKMRVKKMKDKETQSIYTQEMKDAGEFPKVGMMVELQFNVPSQNKKGELLALTKDYAILRDSQTMEQHYHLGLWAFIATDTRTNKQKLTDQIDEYIIDNNVSAVDTDKLVEAFMNNEFEHLEYMGDK